MPPKNSQGIKRMQPSEIMTVGARSPSPTTAVPPTLPKHRKLRATQMASGSSQATQAATQSSSQSNSAGKRWHNDSIDGGPTSLELLCEWLGDPDNLDYLKHGLKGLKSQQGAQACSEWMQTQGGPVYRSAKAILGKYDRLRKSWQTAEAWRNGTGNGQGIQVARDAEPGEEGKAKAAQTIDDEIYSRCPHFDLLHPIFSNRIGGTASLRGDSSVPLSQDTVFNGMKEYQQSKKEGKQPARSPAPSLPRPSGQEPSQPLTDRLDREPTFSPSHWIEPEDEANVLEDIGRGDILDRSSPIGQASLSDSRSNPRHNPLWRRSPSLSTFDGSTETYLEAEASWRSKKEEEWRKQERYREKKLQAVEQQIDIDRKGQIRELAKELRERNPDLSIKRSLLDARELLDKV